MKVNNDTLAKLTPNRYLVNNKNTNNKNNININNVNNKNSKTSSIEVYTFTPIGEAAIF